MESKAKVAGGKFTFSYYKYRERGSETWHPRAIREGTEERVLNAFSQNGEEFEKITKEEYDNLLQQKRG